MNFNIIDCVLFSELANRDSANQKNMQVCKNASEGIEKIENFIENKEYFLNKDSDAELISFNQKNKNTFHLTFIGSNSKKDWIADFNFIPIKIKNLKNRNYKIHQGIYLQFLSVYDHVKSKLQKFLNNKDKIELVISGHSLGGGLAIIAGIYLYGYLIKYKNIENVEIKIITIGAPRVLNKELSEWFNKNLSKNTIRIVNHFDSIPQLPLQGNVFEYMHVEGMVVYFKNNCLLNSIPKNRTIIDRIKSLYANFKTHGIDSYVNELNSFEILKKTKIC